jgi:hypothetical protein
VIYIGEPAILTVSGEEGATFRWYEDSLLTTLLHTGETYESEKTGFGTYTYYVTQKYGAFESAPDTVTLSISYRISTYLLNALIDRGVDENGDGLISDVEASVVTELDLVCPWDMTGIELFVNLERLSCFDGYLNSLDISKNTALTELNCGGNELTNLDVSNNFALKRLGCEGNQLTSLDVSNNTVLESLNCGENQLTNLTLCSNGSLCHLVIGGMPSLDTVYVFPMANVNVSDTGSPNYVFLNCTTGFTEYNNDGFHLYPNPTNDLLTIETSQPGIRFIEITSLNGQLILSREMEGTTHQLDLSSFQKGVYFITVGSKDFVTTRKIIKL